jgi:hypothetical protein
MENREILDTALRHTGEVARPAGDIASKGDVKNCKDEVMRRIGRNLLLFQQIEGVIKFLVANGNISGPASTLLAQREQRAASIQKRTMGQLIGQFTDDFLSDADKEMEAREHVQEPWLKIVFKIQGDVGFNEQQKIDFETVVAERNELVHHFLERWDVQSIDSGHEVTRYLDEQREKVLPVFERLKSMMNSRREGQSMLAALLESNEFEQTFEKQWLCESRLVALLKEVAIQEARSDGWLPLAAAGQYLRLHATEEFSALKQRYGFATLKKLAVATELFDVEDELTNKGGTRTVYRIRDA